jgi:hypothetical protein
MIPFLVLLIAVGLVWAFFRPAAGLWLVVLSGFGQELVRKIVPGQSAYWQGLVVAVAVATFAGAFARNPPSWWRWREWKPLRGPVEAFMVVLALQAGVSFVRTDSVVLPLVGLVAYMGPLASVAVGSWLGATPRAVIRTLELYLALAVVMASGILLVQAGVSWPILQPIGGGLVVYTWERIALPSGFFRSPEVASWHCATAACVAVVLATVRRRASLVRNVMLAIAFALMVFGVFAAGRRKGILEIAVFLVSFWLLQLVGGRGLGRLRRAGILLAIIAGFLLTREDVQQRTSGAREAMLNRERDPGGSSIATRLREVVAVVPMMTEKFGPLGLGLGTLTQGSRYFGADLQWGVASESGPYRLAVELGLAGVAVVALVVIRLVRLMLRRLKKAHSWANERALLATGLVAVLVANGSVFLTAHQIFGDPFVFLWLGLLAGFAFAQIAGVRAGRESISGEVAPPSAPLEATMVAPAPLLSPP